MYVLCVLFQIFLTHSLFLVIYTYYTIHELGDIPLFCPSNYPYKNSKLLKLCQIRIANLICMWVMFVITLIATIIMCIPEETYKNFVGIEDDHGKAVRID
jgi:hypothetical protein